MSSLLKDCSVSALVAGLIATVISYAGPLVIVFQAAHSAGLGADVLSSWVLAISLGSGVLGIVLSLYYRVPVIIAWSAPGSALLVALLPTVSFNEAIGAYLVANTLILIVGLSGSFDRIVSRLPAAISAAMLAGILFSFGVELFRSVKVQPLLVLTMFVTYLLGRRLLPRYAVPAVLIVGMVMVLLTGEFNPQVLVLDMAVPVFTAPAFTWQATLNIALPLVLVALSGQFLPGMAVLRNDGYQTSARPIIAGSAATSLLLAPFACHGLNLAAITAAICTGREAHIEPSRRYVAGVSGGVLYLVLGIFGTTVVSLFSAFPKAMIAALAGLALFSAIGSSLSSAMGDPADREAALITFLVTASGMSFMGLSAAFWGLILGLLAHVVLSYRTSVKQANKSLADTQQGSTALPKSIG